MSACIVKKLECHPAFDLFGFMELSQEKRLDASSMQQLDVLWDNWLPLLGAYNIVCGRISYLLVWLPREVEDTVDKLWDETPSEGYLANTLAQYLCMQAINEILPQVENVGCAPAPRPTQVLKEALQDFDIGYKEELDVLNHRFAVVTFMPFRGGCEICHLQKHCPKGNGETGTSVLLPGYEKR